MRSSTFAGDCVRGSELVWCVLVLMRNSDDQYIFETGVVNQPSEETSVLCGFVYISHLWRRESRCVHAYSLTLVTGQVIGRRQVDRRAIPQGLSLQMRLNEIDELYGQIMGLMVDCPPALQRGTAAVNEKFVSMSVLLLC